VCGLLAFVLPREELKPGFQFEYWLPLRQYLMAIKLRGKPIPVVSHLAPLSHYHSQSQRLCHDITELATLQWHFAAIVQQSGPGKLQNEKMIGAWIRIGLKTQLQHEFIIVTNTSQVSQGLRPPQREVATSAGY
jgi:hypothetical protein